jgi:hypothetical protein
MPNLTGLADLWGFLLIGCTNEVYKKTLEQYLVFCFSDFADYPADPDADPGFCAAAYFLFAFGEEGVGTRDIAGL